MLKFIGNRIRVVIIGILVILGGIISPRGILNILNNVITEVRLKER